MLGIRGRRGESAVMGDKPRRASIVLQGVVFACGVLAAAAILDGWLARDLVMTGIWCVVMREISIAWREMEGRG